MVIKTYLFLLEPDFFENKKMYNISGIARRFTIRNTTNQSICFLCAALHIAIPVQITSQIEIRTINHKLIPSDANGSTNADAIYI